MASRFIWCDAMTTDVEAAGRFYGEVMGWGVQDVSPPGGAYWLFTLDGQGVAGLMPIRAGVQAAPAWMNYIGVDDVDAAAARIQREGGSVLQAPAETPGVIRYAVVADPQGARFMVAKGLGGGVAEFAPGTPGTAGWRELLTTDPVGAFAFYEAMFGWTGGEAFDMGPFGRYQQFSTGAGPVGGIMALPADAPAPLWGVYFNVESMDEALSKVRAGGGRVTIAPRPTPGGTLIANALDPQGARFALDVPV